MTDLQQLFADIYNDYTLKYDNIEEFASDNCLDLKEAKFIIKTGKKYYDFYY